VYVNDASEDSEQCDDDNDDDDDDDDNARTMFMVLSS